MHHTINYMAYLRLLYQWSPVLLHAVEPPFNVSWLWFLSLTFNFSDPRAIISVLNFLHFRFLQLLLKSSTIQRNLKWRFHCIAGLKITSLSCFCVRINIFTIFMLLNVGYSYRHLVSCWHFYVSETYSIMQ